MLFSIPQPAGPRTVIEVSPVAFADAPLEEVSYKEAVEYQLGKSEDEEWSFPGSRRARPVEACAHYHGGLVPARCHPVVAAAHLAFADHRPLVLSPDIVWLLLAQGFAHHVNAHAEELRPKIVRHAGRLELSVRRDDFIKGSPENPWTEVFDALTQQIRRHVGDDTHDLLLPRFSTTGPVERAAAQVVLLDSVQQFFEFRTGTKCGIPRVVLEGTVGDWEDVARRARQLARFGLEWWIEPLTPILGEFVAAAQGRVHVPFWECLYNWNNGSGGPFISGWITAFFPYLLGCRTGEPNPWLAPLCEELQALLAAPPEQSRGRRPTTGHHLGGMTHRSFSDGLARVPFVWEFWEKSFAMEFLGGFMGVRQDEDTRALRPEIGWAVRDQAKA